MSTPRPDLHDPTAFAAAAAKLDRPLGDWTYVVFDTETTGLRPTAGDEIVAIGAVAVRADGAFGATFEALVHPGRRIPPRATAIHGITDAMVAAAPRAPEVLQRFHAYLDAGVLVAHNAAFDLLCLRLKEEQAGIRFRGPALDTQLLARWLEPQIKDLSLDGLLARHGIAHPARHSALADAMATAELFRRQLRAAQDRGVQTLADLVAITRTNAELRAREHAFRLHGQ